MASHSLGGLLAAGTALTLGALWVWGPAAAIGVAVVYVVGGFMILASVDQRRQ